MRFPALRREEKEEGMKEILDVRQGATGLTDEQVLASRRQYGANTLTRKKRKGFFRQYLSSFADPIIRILLVALFINVLFLFRSSDWLESAGIAVAVFLSTFVSTLSQYGSESAFLELQKSQANVFCRVRRAKGVVSLPVAELVVGDAVILEAGEKIPADGSLISGRLHVDQSALNGESAEAEKLPFTGAGKGDLSDKGKLFMGSAVSSGEGVMLVERVGDRTFYGRMAKEIQEEPPESPLRVKLSGLAKILGRIGYVAAVLIAVADLFNSFFLDNGMNLALALADMRSWRVCLPRLTHALTLAIAVVVVAVPEGLPMMIAVVLSSNMLRMSKDNVLVRKPVGIEASGGLNILFTDKTGTLTKGEQEVVKIVRGDGQVSDEIRECPQPIAEALRISAFFNTGSSLSRGKPVGGNATDRALMKNAASPAPDPEEYERVSALPFDSARKFSAAGIEAKKGERILSFGKRCCFVKGAPEKLLPGCTKYLSEKGEILPFSRAETERKLRAYTGRAMRVIAVAVREGEVTGEKDLCNLVFVALMVIRDDIRPEVPSAIAEAVGAGVQVVMITGDNPGTAEAVAEEIGLISGKRGEKSEGKELVLTGEELAKMTDEELAEALPRIRVVARALPTDKSRLVRVAQSKGLVTGMTGDGINDAPALKKADVGFAMGSGTEVAKEAGDVVITDNNFASIAKAIRYGRTIFKSIRKFVVFQLTMNLCAVGVSLIAPFIGIDTPVTVIQMLWINIIMDALAGLAFAGEPALKEYMEETPVRRDERVLDKTMVRRILFIGGYTVGLCLAFLKAPVFRSAFGYGENSVRFYTAFFALFVFSGLFNAFNARTDRINLLSHLSGNKTFAVFILLVAAVQLVLIYFGGSVFRCAGLTARELFTVLALAFTVIPVEAARRMISKAARKRRARSERGTGKQRAIFTHSLQNPHVSGTN